MKLVDTFKTRNVFFRRYLENNKMTHIINISTHDGEEVGSIVWHSGWRKYVFCPQHSESFIDVEMMHDIILQIEELTDEVG